MAVDAERQVAHVTGAGTAPFAQRVREVLELLPERALLLFERVDLFFQCLEIVGLRKGGLAGEGDGEERQQHDAEGTHGTHGNTSASARSFPTAHAPFPENIAVTTGDSVLGSV